MMGKHGKRKENGLGNRMPVGTIEPDDSPPPKPARGDEPSYEERLRDEFALAITSGFDWGPVVVAKKPDYVSGQVWKLADAVLAGRNASQEIDK